MVGGMSAQLAEILEGLQRKAENNADLATRLEQRARILRKQRLHRETDPLL